MSKKKRAQDIRGGTKIEGGVRVDHGDFVGRDKIVHSRSEQEELGAYLDLAVARYDAAMGRAERRLPTRFDDPYRSLEAFKLEHAHLFFGRDEARQKLHDRVVQNRLTVVHARSGAGKTSLLNAGLAPRLIGEDRLPVYARAGEDPARAIVQPLVAHARGPRPALLSKLTLHELLGMICARLGGEGRELVIILDQFEEFFVFLPEREHRQPFIDELADCYDDHSLPLRLVIALRQDYLSYMADFNDRIPTILGNQYRLEAMTRAEAKAAIVQPLSRLEQPVAYEPALLEALLDDLARGGMELPQLQILCARLWRERKDGEAHITLACYESLGRAKGILTGYLKKELAELPGRQGPLAREVLKELVSFESTKRLLDRGVLAARIDAEAEELDEVLAKLVERRLLHREEVEGEVRYEMTHEYLIEEIRQWIEPADLALKQAQELLAGEVATWRRSACALLIPRDRLELLYEQRERLKGLDDESWQCILASALEAGFAVDDWVALAGEQRLVTMLGDPDERVRRAATRALGHLWCPEDVARLGAETHSIRWEVARALAEHGDPRALGPLVAALGHESKYVREDAATALGELGDPRAVGPLIAALGDEEARVRREAASVLGELGDGRALEPLIAALRDEDAVARKLAAGALGKLGDARAVAPLVAALGDQDHYVGQVATSALMNLGEPAVESLIAALGDGEAQVRWAAASVLGELGDARALAPLITALGDRDGDVREITAWALGGFADPQAVAPLITALGDERGGVRRQAAGALGELGDPRAVDPLIASLRDEGDTMLREAAGALAALGEPAVEPLLAALGAKEGDVRVGATDALGELGDPRAVKPLIAALGDKEGKVRARAALALGNLGDTQAVKPLIAALGDDDGYVRWLAATALGQLGDRQAVDPLIVALGDDDADVRARAALALGVLGDRRAAEPLIAALKDEKDSVRWYAAGALGKLGDARGVDPLVAALGDTDHDVCKEAAGALGALGDPRAIAPLIGVLGDMSSGVRRSAAGALAAFGEPAMAPLTAALRDQDAGVRRGVALVLGDLGGGRAVDPLIAALGDKDEGVRKAAARALGKLGEPRAVGPLVAALGDEDDYARELAAEALAALGEPALEPLKAALRDEDGNVRQGATWALEKIGTPEAWAALDESERSGSE